MLTLFASFFAIDFASAQTTNPTLNVLTKNLAPGGNVFVTGSGFESSSTFVVKLDGAKLGTVSTTSEGKFSQYLNIPHFVSIGEHTITIERGQVLQSVKVSITKSQIIPQYMQAKLDAEKSSSRSGGIAQQGVGNIPGRQSAESDKITICHVPPGNPENAHSITISKSALETHLAHGDSVGECKIDSKKPSVAGGVTKESEREASEESENLDDKVKNEDKDDEESVNKDSDIKDEDVVDSNKQESVNKDTEKDIKSSTGSSSAASSSSSSSEKSGTKKIPSTDIAPTSGKPETKVSISGIDFPPNSSVTLVSNSLGIRAISVKTSSVGAFSTTITIPSNTPSDTYPIEIISDSNRGTEYFTVIGSNTKSETTTGEVKSETTIDNAKSGTKQGISVTLFPDSGPPGTKTTISGSNFPANVDVSLLFKSLAIRTVTLKTDASGSFSTTITIPTSTLAGSYPIEILSEVYVDPQYFTVIVDSKAEASSVKAFGTPKTASLKVLPETGPPGAILTFAGFGFVPEKNYQIYFANDEKFISFVTDKEGNFKRTVDSTPIFSVSTTLPFHVKDDDTKSILASTEWTQTAPTISISKSSGSKDTTFTLSGSGFISTKVVDLVFDGVKGDSVTTNSAGLLSSYKIPSYYLRLGDHVVQIMQNGIVVSSASFTVPQGLETSSAQENNPLSRGKTLTVSPTNGPPGTKLTFTGDGFSSTKSYRIFNYPNTIHQSPIIEPIKDGTFSVASNGVVLGVSVTTQFHIVESGSKSILASTEWTQTAPTISISKSSGSKDTTFTLEGSGFAASKTVDIMVDGLHYDTVSTSPSETLSVSQIPIYATTATHTVQIIQNKVVVASIIFDAQ